MISKFYLFSNKKEEEKNFPNPVSSSSVNARRGFRNIVMDTGWPNFLFLAIFWKKIHKYAPGGKISKSGPLARRHRCWRRANTSRRQRPWRRALRLEANVEVTWQEARRQSLWCRARCQDLRRRARCQSDWREFPAMLPSTFALSPGARRQGG